MKTNSRREVLGALAVSGAMLAPRSASAASGERELDFGSLTKDTDVACLYHCDFGEPQRFSQMMQNMLNHYSAYDHDPMRLKLVVVAHGPGVKFFLKDLSGTPWERETIDPELFKRFESLSKYGAEAYLCQITFKRLNVDPAKARPDEFLKFVPPGVATVGELQSKGFGYIKVG
jgi:hypothetical protein